MQLTISTLIWRVHAQWCSLKSTWLEIGSGLWETRGVNKPELVITSSPDDELLSGKCSSCPAVQFRLRGNNLRHKEVMRGLFDKHFKRVHMRKDASQAAARIESEATGNK
jgi:hypothetical protein